MKIKTQKIKLLSFLLIISFPIKLFSLLFIILYGFWLLLNVAHGNLSINKLNTFYITFLFIFQCFFVSFYYSPLFVFNVLLFFVFFSPIFWLLTIKDVKYKNVLSLNDLKGVIEAYLIIQIFFSMVNMLYRIATRGLSFDTDFGDIVAGTFRMPFTYKADVSNPIFALTVTLILIFYIIVYKKNVNKLLIFFSFIVIFMASVNHLILALLFASMVAYFSKYFLKFLIVAFLIYFLYSFLQPGNYNMILERVNKVLLVFTDIEFLNKIGYKGQYFYKWIEDFYNHTSLFLFTGLGAGTYSSRAAMFFSGDYIQNFPVENMTHFMQDNTMFLWKKFLQAPAWMQGSFNYPFNSVFSLIAEIGLVNFIIINVLFWEKLKRLKAYSLSNRIFLAVLLIILGLVDNYYEYFQVFFIFYILNITYLNNINKTSQISTIGQR